MFPFPVQLPFLSLANCSPFFQVLSHRHRLNSPNSNYNVVTCISSTSTHQSDLVMPLFARSRSSSSASSLNPFPSQPSTPTSSQRTPIPSLFSQISKNVSSRYPTSNRSPTTQISTGQGAHAYLAALAVRSSSSSDTSSLNSTTSTSTSISDDSSDASSIRTTYSYRSSHPSSSLPDPSLVDRILGTDTVYSNDYGVPIHTSGASTLSKYPPRNASQLPPARHFDADPFYVPPALQGDPHALRHSEYGYSNEKYEYTSQFRKRIGAGGEDIEEPSHLTYLTTYVSYLVLIIIGHMRDFVGKRTHRKSYQHLMPHNVSCPIATNLKGDLH